MDRFRVLAALALVLAIVAIGTVAGGLSGGGSGEQSPGIGFGSGEGSGIGESDDLGLGGGQDVESELPEWLTLGPFLLVLWVSGAAAAIVTLVFLWTASLREILATIRESLATLMVIGIAIGLLILLFMLLGELFSGGGGGLMGENGAINEDLFGDSTSTESTSFLSGLALLAGAVIVGILIVMLLPGDDEEHDAADEAGPEEPAPEPTSGGGPSLPGVEDPDASNEVYQAWIGLRDRVGRSDRTESPAELRRRALDAGLDERAVTELTNLFNAARYGDRPVTTDEERRAREALESLEGSGGNG